MFRWLRILLPAISLGILVLALFWSQIIPRATRVGVDTQPPDARSDQPGEAVSHATYSGVDHLGRPFSVTAERVDNPEGEDHRVELTRPSGQLVLQDGTVATLAAEDGVYDQAQNTLALHGDVTLRHADLAARSASASIDLKSSTASGDDAVEGWGDFGTISGQGFHVAEDGNTISVAGPARMVIVPGAKATLR